MLTLCLHHWPGRAREGKRDAGSFSTTNQPLPAGSNSASPRLGARSTAHGCRIRDGTGRTQQTLTHLSSDERRTGLVTWVLVPSKYTVAWALLETAARTNPCASLPDVDASALRTRALPPELCTLTRSPAASASEAWIEAVSAPMPTGIMELSSFPVASSAGSSRRRRRRRRTAWPPSRLYPHKRHIRYSLKYSANASRATGSEVIFFSRGLRSPSVPPAGIAASVVAAAQRALF
jgi:hypothetical protein